MKNLHLGRFLLLVLLVAIAARVSRHFFPQVDFFFLLFVLVASSIVGEYIRTRMLRK